MGNNRNKSDKYNYNAHKQNISVAYMGKLVRNDPFKLRSFQFLHKSGGYANHSMLFIAAGSKSIRSGIVNSINFGHWKTGSNGKIFSHRIKIKKFILRSSASFGNTKHNFV